MDLVQRVKSITLQPRQTGEEIGNEGTTVARLYTSYAAILALVPAVAGFIGRSAAGVSLPFFGTWRQPVVNGLIHAVLYYALSMAGI